MVCYVYTWVYITALVLMACVAQLEDILESMDLVFKIGIPVTHLLVILEACCSSELEYIQNLADSTGTEEFLVTLRQSSGVITFHAVCYHWETRTRTVTERDSKGNTTTKTETYQEKVVTHVGAETYEHGRQVDVSPASIKSVTGPSNAVTRVNKCVLQKFYDKLYYKLIFRFLGLISSYRPGIW